ncbi:hypothetical protein IWW38_000922 [Coemansia aciculifera]|uniref:Uncharacterized protein n=1 Tax=Coemansia aciculifera TaxID=417176 RepID=A0ACC1M9J1_9FUNG|nr:hypothetical protein IWW38_000922 [Coemansia aciculifera]
MTTATPAFKSTISKQPFYYFTVELQTTSQAPVDSRQYQGYVQYALKQWVGDIGAGMSVDILDTRGTRVFDIRVPFDQHKQVWQALTLTPFKMPDGTNARLQVLRGSAFAMGLAAGSRHAFSTSQ